MSVAAAETPRAHTWTVQAGEETANHAIQGMAFLPANVFIHAGDTVKWAANSAEIHTITFLADQTVMTPPPFDPTDPTMLFPVGGPVYHAGSYFNSGLLANIAPGGFPFTTSYSLTFPTTGKFTYFCLVHGEMMKGVVHVIPASKRYPFSQKDYNRQARETTRAILRDGRMLAADTRESVEHSRTVAMGADDGVAMVMRFIQPTIRIRLGQQVTFTNTGMAAPHTVTFGTEPANFFPPSGDPTNYTGGDLNSGIVGPGGTFTVTFNKAGTFGYICALHDYMGMVGKVIVGDSDGDDD
ncbi:MAG: plastocyanin/azurin family copper-binding protein [Actinomycetota bacterium]|nr:plastocyanin/azurin family copper-binding protein [Actinomycetota bacterium]